MCLLFPTTMLLHFNTRALTEAVNAPSDSHGMETGISEFKLAFYADGILICMI